MRGRQWRLACGHTLGSMHYNCRACQEEYVAAEQAQMIVRPEGEPPLNPEGDPTKPFGGSYRWDFISRYIDGFRLQLAAEGKDGYDAQMKQYLSAEAARYQGFIADGTAGAPPIGSPAAEQADLHIRDLRSRVEFMAQSQSREHALRHLCFLAVESREQSIWPPLRPAAESREQSIWPPLRPAAESRELSIWPPQGPAPRILLRLWPLLLLRSAWTAPSVPLPSLPPALLLAPTLPWLFSLKQLSVLSMLASRLALPRLTPPPLVQLVLGVASLTLVPRSRQFILPTEGRRLECGCLLPTLRGQSIPPPLLLAAAVLADASSPRFSSLVMRIRLGRGERSGSDCRAPICRLSFQSLHRHLHHRPHRQSECRSPGQLSGITVWWSSNWSSAGRTAAVVVCPIVRNASDASRGPRAAVKITSVVGAAHPPSLSSARVPPRQMARLGRGS